jgi:transcriptional regulator with XRE-family HTH domain
MDLRDILARNVRKMRRRLGLSQEELAFRAGIDRTYVSMIERSVNAATVDVLEALAKALDASPSELLQP